MESTVVEDPPLSEEDPKDHWNLRTPPKTPPPGPARQPQPEPKEPADVDENGGVMRVSAGSPAQAVAYSIQRVIFTEIRMPTIRAIGAGAVNQAVKGIAIARGMVAVRGVDLGCAMGFDNVINDAGEEISSVVFRLYLR